jgi:hypothetical protein
MFDYLYLADLSIFYIVYNIETLKSFWVRIGCPTLEHTSVIRRRLCSFGTLEVVETHTKEIGIP